MSDHATQTAAPEARGPSRVRHGTARWKQRYGRRNLSESRNGSLIQGLKPLRNPASELTSGRNRAKLWPQQMNSKTRRTRTDL